MTPPTAIVGAGLMGRWHAHAAERAGATIVAVVDPLGPQAAALASRHRGAIPFPSLAAALADRPVSSVHLCTPPDSHEALAREALAAGAHILIEKPFAPSVAATAAILAQAEAAGRLAVPVHQLPFQHGVRDAMRLLPRIGTLRHFHHLICSAGADGTSPERADQIAQEVLPHPLSLVQGLLPAALDGVAWRAERPGHGQLILQGSQAGVGMQVVISMAGRPPVNQAILIGTLGTLRLDLFHGYLVHEAGTATRGAKIRRPFGLAIRQLTAAGSNLVRRLAHGEAAYPGLDALVIAFYAAIAGTAPPPISARQTLEVARACAAIRSAVFSTKA